MLIKLIKLEFKKLFLNKGLFLSFSLLALFLFIVQFQELSEFKYYPFNLRYPAHTNYILIGSSSEFIFIFFILAIPFIAISTITNVYFVEKNGGYRNLEITRAHSRKSLIFSKSIAVFVYSLIIFSIIFLTFFILTYLVNPANSQKVGGGDIYYWMEYLNYGASSKLFEISVNNPTLIIVFIMISFVLLMSIYVLLNYWYIEFINIHRVYIIGIIQMISNLVYFIFFEIFDYTKYSVWTYVIHYNYISFYTSTDKITLGSFVVSLVIILIYNILIIYVVHLFSKRLLKAQDI